MERIDGQVYTLTLTVRDRPGVLVRCAQVLGRRRHDITALRIATESKGSETSTMIIDAFGQTVAIPQIIAQLSKIIDVINVTKKE